MSQKTLEDIQDYYGVVIETTDDLKTSACCPLEAPPKRVQDLLKNVHDVVQSKFYGCGSPIPPVAEGLTILDLGSGTGRDAFILSQIVGEKGKVIGVDMTDEQLKVANDHIDWHMEKFGYSKPNVEFHKGYIEDLQSIGIKDESIDIVISNCVLNLSPDKERVFTEIMRVLKPGGELFFSDVFSGRRVPEELQNDKVLRGECLGGAMYIEDFRRIMAKNNVQDIRCLSTSPITIEDEELYNKAGMIDFYSKTIRAFKVDLEDVCEDYGHVAYYKGTIAEAPHSFILDDHHEFKTGKPMLVCGNTYNILAQTRLNKHFRLEGNFKTHYGIFDCAPDSSEDTSGNCC